MSQTDKAGVNCPECNVLNAFPSEGQVMVTCTGCKAKFKFEPVVDALPMSAVSSGKSLDHDDVEDRDYYN